MTQNQEKLLELSYNDENHLKEIKTVHGTSTNYVYGQQELKLLNALKKFPVHESPSIGTCGNFLIFVTKLPNALEVEIIESTTLLVVQKIKVETSISSDSSMEIRSFGRDFLIGYKVSSHNIIRVFKLILKKNTLIMG